MSVGANRTPVRPLEIANISLAYPGELLIDPNTGNFTYKTIGGSTIVHSKPGKLTVTQGDSTIVNAVDMSQDISFEIPEAQTVSWDDIAPEHISASIINGLTANKVAIADASGNLTSSTIDASKILYLENVSYDIQSQLNGKSGIDHNHDTKYIPFSGGTITGGLTPNQNNTIDLGSATTVFRNIYANTFVGTLSGNASTATTLATARMLTIGNTGKSFNGSSSLAWSLDEIGAAASNHTHSNYIPFSGGTITGGLTPNQNNTIDLGSASAAFRTVYATTFDGNLSGNAATASKFDHAINIQIGNIIQQIDGSETSIVFSGIAASNHTHTGSDIIGFTANRAIISNADGELDVSTVTSTQLGYLANVSSDIQNQLNNKAASNHTHSNYLPTSGGTITGGLTPSGNGTINLGSSSYAFRNIYATNFSGNLSGNAITATSLENPVGITIGNKTNQFDGMFPISWTVNEIGAAALDHTHNAMDISVGTANRVLISNSSGTISTSGITNTELNYLSGVSSNIQNQLDDKAAASHTHSGYIGAAGGTITGTLTVSGTLNVTGSATGIQKVYSGTLSTSWTGSSAPYSQVVTVSGILASDRPILDYTNSGTYSTDQSREEGWLNIYRAVTAANRITFYAHDKPTVSIPFTALVTR